MNKKKWIAVIVILVLIVTGVVSYLAVFKGEGKEPSAEDLFPKIQEVSSVPRLKATGEIGLQLAAQINQDHWERIGALSVVVKVKNVSDKTLQKAIVVKTLFDGTGAAIGIKNTQATDVSQLKPGEVFTANLDMLSVNSGSISKVEFSFKQGSVVWVAAHFSPTPTPPNVITNQPRTSIGEVSYSISNYPKDPKLPEEVVVAFFFLLKEKKYLDAARLIEKVEQLIQEGKVDEKLATVSLGEVVVLRDSDSINSIKIENVYIGPRSSTGKIIARVEVAGYSDGIKKDSTQLSLVNESGKWKMEANNFNF